MWVIILISDVSCHIRIQVQDLMTIDKLILVSVVNDKKSYLLRLSGFYMFYCIFKGFKITVTKTCLKKITIFLLFLNISYKASPK